MSIVRQLAKAKAREQEKEREGDRLRDEIESGSIEVVPNRDPAPHTHDPIQDMNYRETWLGAVDFQCVQGAVAAIVPNKRGKYQKYTERERYAIGRYGSEYGATAAVRKFKKDFPSLNESTVRPVKERYEELL